MAVIRIGEERKYNVREYIGLSTDEKPTDCDPGSSLMELDTKDIYIYDGEEWHNMMLEDEEVEDE